MFNPLAWFGKRRAIGSFLRALPKRLREDYGHLGPYSAEQVERCIIRHRVSGSDFIPYAIAIFCSPDSFDAGELRGSQYGDLTALREEVAGSYFEGNQQFDLKDVFSHSAEHSAAGVSAEHGHGGFDHGGHGGGSH